jgi:hypothetical protein
VLSILPVGKDDSYGYVLASAIHSHFLYSLVSFNQEFTADVITKDKREEFAA